MVLSQEQQGKVFSIAYGSQGFRPTERKTSTTELQFYEVSGATGVSSAQVGHD